MLVCLFGLDVAAAASTPKTREWTVGGDTRRALIFLPESPAAGAPVIFAFHGHGGSMAFAARSFKLHEKWPEALVVYPQGLPTPGALTDPDGKKSGWQSRGGLQGDRDLAFFDAMLASLKSDGGIDPKRIYATGHSNGGGFSYLLWAKRPDEFAAFASVAAILSRFDPPKTPKPIIHIAGKADPLVKFDWQERTVRIVRELNQCESGAAWKADASCTFFASAKGAPVVVKIHDGGHQYPAEASDLIVTFFKENRLD